MTVVVAGAGGYIGGRLVRHLAGAGVDVIPLVRTARAWLPSTQCLLDLRQPSRQLHDVLDGADAVVHLAGPSEVVASAHPETALADTVAITSVLGAAAVAAGIERFVYLSTVHVYGTRLEAGAHIDEDTRCEPRHPYAIARLASEHVLAGLHLHPTVLRLTNSVGAPADPAVDRWTLVVNDLCRQAAVQGSIQLHTDGTQWRDFVALTDAVDVISRLCTASAAPGTWNVGSGRPTTVRAVAGLVQDQFEALTGHRPVLVAPPVVHPATAAPLVDVSRLAGLGIECRTPVETAVSEVAQFCVDHRSVLRG